MIFENMWALLVVVAISLFGAAEVGYRVGLSLNRTKDDARRSQIGGVQGAVLGLLGLLIGFTFSMGVSRYESRRNLVLKEANAVGTTWLRAGLLPEAHRAPAKELLRRYVDVRLKYQALGRDAAALSEGLRLSADLQNQLWQGAEAVAAEKPTPITLSYINALNGVIDTDAERIAAARNQIPGGVWGLLIIVAASGCFISGYGSGAQGARSLFTMAFLPALITVVILLVFDLTHSHEGIIGISQQPLIDLQNSMSAATNTAAK
ncbi:MAG TPA: hypothetical protein VM735_09355 [Candidatus Kapabacteria bacterium]|nr:hypothetical protein [Candidatus Kapabacteria bacterium]